MPDLARTTFALALMGLDGVGRVTASRLLHHFGTLDTLRSYPREQVLSRLKGTPRAAELVERLVNPTAMQQPLAEAKAHLAELTRRRITLVTQGEADWPVALDALPRSERPVVLHLFGDPTVLSRPLAAFFAHPPLSPDAFEHAQALLLHLLENGIAPATGTATGFDIVMHKRATSGPAACPSLLVAPCGMARIASQMRPTVSLVAKAKGLLISPFPMQHGPFPHDDRERALVLAAVTDTAIFIEPKPDTANWAALHGLLEQGRSVFGIAAPEHPLPAPVHPLASATDFDWVVASTQT